MRAGKLLAVMFAAFVAVAHAESVPDYTAAEAGKHVGETATVTDTVARVNKAAGGNTFMNLGSGGRDSQFTIFIGASDAATVGDVEQYQGKTVTVSGTITTFREKPQIQVKSADQIKVKEEKSSDEAGSAKK
jgi:DNA/RNA endonuclease YhcR with UshA esterase domain